MKSKNLNFMIAGAFIFIFLIGLTGATLTLSSVSELSQTGSSFNIQVTSDQNETVAFSVPSISDGQGKYITFTPKLVTLNSTNPTATVTIPYLVESGFNFEFEKTYSTLLSANGSVSGVLTRTLTFAKSNFCEYSNSGGLRIKINDMIVTKGFGEDEEWLPFDEVEIEIEVQNRGNEDLDNIVVEWGLYNPDTGEWTIEITDENDFNLNENDEEILTVSFTIDNKMDEDLEDLKGGTYVFYVRATGDIDNSSDMSTCESVSKDVKIVIEKDFVILSDFQYSEIIQCSSEFHFSAEAWNIGSKDQDNVYAKIINRELGLDKTIEIGDLNSFDNEAVDFYFNIPDDADEKKYSVTISIYDEDDDVFQNDYNDDSSIYDISFTIEGGCATPQASVSAVLESGGQAGKPTVIKATVINTGKKQTTYLLNAAGYTPWASSARVEPNTFTLAPGESKVVAITFDVNKEAVGNQLFNLEILSDNQLIANQPVEIPIKKTGFKLPSFSVDNWHLWAIGALNIILVIFIIVIAVRISRK